MEPEDKKLLRETLELAKDNNKMLHKIRRGQKWASFVRIIYWLIIIGASVGAWYYLQPYVNKVLNLYNQIPGTNNTGINPNAIGDFLKNYNITPR